MPIPKIKVNSTSRKRVIKFKSFLKEFPSTYVAEFYEMSDAENGKVNKTWALGSITRVRPR